MMLKITIFEYILIKQVF